MTPDPSTSLEATTELPAESPTVIEGLPGLGLVAAVAVDQITKQLELDQHGTIVSDDFPSVAAFDEGRVRDAVRVYAGADPGVMTLQSDVPVPRTAIDSLSRCVLSDLAEEFEQAIFHLPHYSRDSEIRHRELITSSFVDEFIGGSLHQQIRPPRVIRSVASPLAHDSDRDG